MGSNPTPRTKVVSSGLDIQGWFDKLYRRSNSQGTVESAAKGIAAFETFAMQRFSTHRGRHPKYPYTDGLLQALKTEQFDAYKVLDSFAAYVSRLTVVLPDGTEARFKPHTVHTRVYAVVGLFRYHDIEVQKETFKQKVTLPKVTEIEDRPVRPDQLHLLYNCASATMRALLLALTSSGMRIGEAAQLRVKDIDFDLAKPAAIVHMRAVTTKTDKARDVFISDEAVQSIQALIAIRNKRPDDYLFFPNNVSSSKRLRKYYNTLLRNVGRKHPEIAQRIEGHSYYNLHLHNIGRKWFFSKAVGVVGETATHSLMGHSFYLKTYYRIPLEERISQYLHTMPVLSFLKKPSGLERCFDVRLVNKDDEAVVFKLLEQGYTFTQELNGKAVYRREATH